jgi:hypothetical protein
MRQATKFQMRGKFRYLYTLNKGYRVMEPAGRVDCHGPRLAASGLRAYARLGRDGRETVWTHMYGVNADLPGTLSDWVEVALRPGGDPRNPADWRPTGQAWEVGSDLTAMARD